MHRQMLHEEIIKHYAHAKPVEATDCAVSAADRIPLLLTIDAVGVDKRDGNLGLGTIPSSYIQPDTDSA